VFQTSSSAYGKGTNVEVYKDSKYNIHVNRDLRALERRLPKGWKKPKWTPRKYRLTQLLTPTTLWRKWARKNDADSTVILSPMLPTYQHPILTYTTNHPLILILYQIYLPNIIYFSKDAVDLQCEPDQGSGGHGGTYNYE
jgi:hypothetical protein